MRKIPRLALRRHMVEDTAGMSPALFEAYATLAAKAALHDGVYCRADAFLRDAHTDELFARGFLAVDEAGNIVLPRLRLLIPSVFTT
jgi:hypothetical protein